MLSDIRKASGHFLFKVISFIIILSFVSWGISDILRSKSDSDIVKFNNIKSIPHSEFLRAKQERIKYIQSVVSYPMTPEQIENLNIDKIVLDGLINDRMFDHATNYYDLYFSDQNIISQMKKNPSFADKKGKFRYDIFENHIKRYGMSESSYIASMKKDLSCNLILSVFNSEYLVPRDLSKQVTKYLNNQVVFDYIEVDPKKYLSFKDSKIPEEDFQKFYDENKEQFIAPEMRDIEYIEIPLDKIQVKVSESEIKEYYDENNHDYNNPALFSYYDIAAKREEDANKILNMLDSGDNVNEVRNVFGDNISVQFNENIEGKLIKDEKLKSSDKPFIKFVDDAYHVIKREIYFPAKKLFLAQAKKEITTIIKQKKTDIALRDFMNDIDDFVAGAKDVDEVAKQFKFKKKSKNRIENTQGNVVYAKAFELDENEFSESFELKPNSNVIVFVKKIYPSKQLDYKESRSKIVRILQDDLAKKNITAKLDRLRNESNSNNFTSNVQNAGFELSINKRMTIAKINEGNPENYPENMLRELFSVKKGEFTSVIPYGNKIYLAILRNRSYAKDIEENTIREDVAKSYQSAIIDELMLYLRKDSNMRIMK